MSAAMVSEMENGEVNVEASDRGLPGLDDAKTPSGNAESNGNGTAQSSKLVAFDVIDSQYEFPLVIKLHVPTRIAGDYESEWNAEQLRSTRLQLLGFKTYERLVLSEKPRAGAAKSNSCSFTLSSSAKIAVKVAPFDALKVYRTTRELVRDFPRYVRVLQDVQYRADFVIKAGEVLELLRTEKRCVKVRGLIDVLVCRHFYREVQFPIDMNTWLCCSPLADDTVYMLSDLVRRFPLPRSIIVQNPHLLRITPTARKLFTSVEQAPAPSQVPVEFIIHELASFTFAVGLSDIQENIGASQTRVQVQAQRPCVVYIQAQPNSSSVSRVESLNKLHRESVALELDLLKPTQDGEDLSLEWPQAEVLLASSTSSAAVDSPILLEEIADYPFLDKARSCTLQICSLDDVLDGALQRSYGGSSTSQYSYANYAVSKSVALSDFSNGQQSTAGVAAGRPVLRSSQVRASMCFLSEQQKQQQQQQQPQVTCYCPADTDSCTSATATPNSTRSRSMQRSELNGYIADPHGATAATYSNANARVGKQSGSSGSFGNMIKKRVVRLFSSSKHNVNITVTSGGTCQDVRRAYAKTGSAPNLHHLGYVKSSQNNRTVVEIPTPGSSISTIISTPTRSKRSPKVVRRTSSSHNQRGDVRNSSVSLHDVKRRTDSLSSLPQNRFNLVDFDIELPDEILAAQFGNSVALNNAAAAVVREDGVNAISKPLTMTYSSTQLQSLGSTPSTTPTSTAVWYPNGCLPHQLSMYNLQMQPAAKRQPHQFEFPPTPKQSMSNGTNSLSSGNEESAGRMKQESSMSLVSINSVPIDDLTVQQLSDYLRKHNLERISLLCEQHCVDGPFFLDLTEEDLSGYPFCASPFEMKCIRRLQKGILPKCD